MHLGDFEVLRSFELGRIFACGGLFWFNRFQMVVCNFRLSIKIDIQVVILEFCFW